MSIKVSSEIEVNPLGETKQYGKTPFGVYISSSDRSTKIVEFRIMGGVHFECDLDELRAAIDNAVNVAYSGRPRRGLR